jgi:hypothetical protein
MPSATSTSIVDLFTEDATVVDEAKCVTGRPRSARGKSAAASKYAYTTEVLDTEALQADRLMVTGRLTGNFPGGTAALKWDFTVSGGRISRLVIAP